MDQGAEQFSVLVGEVAAEVDTLVGVLERQGLAVVRLLLVGFGAVGVEPVADLDTGFAQLERTVGAAQFHHFPFGHL